MGLVGFFAALLLALVLPTLARQPVSAVALVGGGATVGVLADLRAGEPFAAAMGRLAARVPLPQVARFVDGMVIAVERGTPWPTCCARRPPTSVSSTSTTSSKPAAARYKHRFVSRS